MIYHAKEYPLSKSTMHFIMPSEKCFTDVPMESDHAGWWIEKSATIVACARAVLGLDSAFHGGSSNNFLYSVSFYLGPRETGPLSLYVHYRICSLASV